MTEAAVLPFDVDKLGAWLARQGLAAGPLTITPIGEGHSNLTYLVSDGAGRLVLRRPPPPPIPPGANDVLRETRFLLAAAGTGVPVPEVLVVAEAGEVMDVPCYAMAHLEGDVCTTDLPGAIDTPAEHRRIAHALVDVLAALQAIDWQAAGLGDIARPDGFLERQLERLPRLIADEDGKVPAGFGTLGDDLAATRPVSGPPAIVHGDLRLGNVMLSRTAPARILGVLDWELAGIGDPLTDLGYLLAAYAVPGEAPHALTEMSAATLGPGFPTRAELAARYAAATGRDVSRIGWYQAFALWKLAVLFEYSHRRYAGSGGDPYWENPTLARGLLEAARATRR